MGIHGEKKPFLAWYAMLQANTRLTERINAELEAEAGMPLSWFEVLAKLSWAPEACARMGALADDLLLSRGGTTRLIARMEEAGLVRREVPRARPPGHLRARHRQGPRGARARGADPHGQGRRVLPRSTSPTRRSRCSTRAMGKVLRGLGAEDDWLLADLEAAASQ